jgi:hypothetical protein
MGGTVAFQVLVAMHVLEIHLCIFLFGVNT